MYDYIKGSVQNISPTELILENNNIGYIILISLQTYEQLKDKTEAKAYIYHHLREDDEAFFGFATKDEREIFKLLISVSGIGVGSARMILSSLTDEELRDAILSENINKIKAVKGIGLKTAQRLILELKDKIVKGEGVSSPESNLSHNSTIIDEAITALVMLGFSKPNINKVLPAIIKANPEAKVETIIKLALQKL